MIWGVQLEVLSKVLIFIFIFFFQGSAHSDTWAGLNSLELITQNDDSVLKDCLRSWNGIRKNEIR